MAFLASFLQYVIIMIFMTIMAIVGIFIGKTLRINKDEKMANEKLEERM